MCRPNLTETEDTEDLWASHSRLLILGLLYQESTLLSYFNRMPLWKLNKELASQVSSPITAILDGNSGYSRPCTSRSELEKNVPNSD